MVWRAQEEVLHGLGGTLRREIAAADAHDTERLRDLRDSVMERCGFTSDGLGACQLTIQLFARRALLGLPAPVAAARLVHLRAWARGRPEVAEVTEEALRLFLEWEHAPGDGTAEAETIKAYLEEIADDRADLSLIDI